MADPKKEQRTGPSEASIIHGLTILKAHGNDARFTLPRQEAARIASKSKKRSYVACTCDLCRAVERWFQARQQKAVRPRGAG